jgi:hypothetical protein
MSNVYALLIAIILSAAASHWATDLHWSNKWAERDAKDAEAVAQIQSAALTKQRELLQRLDDAYETQKRLQEKHDRNVSDSRIASERLRVELDRIKALPKVTHTSTVAERANAATDRVVLAELLGASDARAGDYAEEADRLRLAVMACNAEYNAIRTKR